MRYFVAPLTPESNWWFYVRDSEFPDQPNFAVWQMWAGLQGAEAMAIAACERFNLIDKLEKKEIELREELNASAQAFAELRMKGTE